MNVLTRKGREFLELSCDYLGVQIFLLHGAGQTNGLEYSQSRDCSAGRPNFTLLYELNLSVHTEVKFTV
jgi:hypothetical protein